MGNLSHPSINRWGLNLFWYNFWYSDKTKSYDTHLDFHLNKLVINFINYGLIVEKDLFFSPYWHNKKSKFYKEHENSFEKNVPFCYRYAQYKNKINNELTLVKFRIKKKNLHFTKVWILRFQNWLIINVYLIQPLKKKFNYVLKKKQKREFLLEYASLTDTARISFLRTIFFFKYLIQNQYIKKNYYYFF